ncbi:hypothetical protein QUF90_16815 [Desulfococcaceae bacterium HSG9]|nr:hypothetical protein [Desulfococcaceae bacterium HSG9]
MKAKTRGFKPECVLSDSRYAGLKNFKTIRDCGQARMTRLKPNRLINPDSIGDIPLSSADISETGTAVYLKGYRFVKVFGIIDRNGGTEYQATDELYMDEFRRIRLSDFSQTIEEYHRGLKQFCGVERC